MSEPTSPPPAPEPAPAAASLAPAAPRRNTWKYTIGVVLLILAGGAGWYVYVLKSEEPTPPDELRALKSYVENLAKTQTLASQYTDKNADLVADAPEDPAKFLKVDEIAFSVVATEKPAPFKLSEKTFAALRAEGMPDTVLAKLQPHKDKEFGSQELFVADLVEILGQEDLQRWQASLLKHADNPIGPVNTWKDFMLALEKATGKKVRYATEIETIQEQVRAVGEGRLHITAFNTGQVPTAVNTAGFVPLFCPADKNGKYEYQMEILVRADSPVQKPEDLKGKTIGLVALSSNSGGKAPLVLFKDKFKLLPGRDYKYTITGDHIRGVKEMLTGRNDAACVASDLLARAVANGEVKPAEFRSIYKSDPFPPLCFGVPHNLPPDLLAKVKQTFTDFAFGDTSVGKSYKGREQVKFAPVNFAADWKLVREVDDSLTHLVDPK